jgi:hypothetical protein
VLGVLDRGAAATAATSPGRVLLDMGADDLQTTGLVLPGVPVVGLEGVRVGVVVVGRAGSAHGSGSLPGPVAGVEGSAGHGWPRERRGVVAGVLAWVQPVPHTRRTGRERRGGVTLRQVVAGTPAGRALTAAAVAGTHGVVGVIAGAVGPPVRLDERPGPVRGVVDHALAPAGRTGTGPPADGREASGHVRRDLVAGRLVPRDAETEALGAGRERALGRGVPSVPRTAELTHVRGRRLSRNCCRMTTAAAWSITARCWRLSMPPSRR